MSQVYTTDCFSTAHVIETDMQNVENNFDALRSLFSGSTAPTSPDAFQLWANTSDSKVYIRTTNSSWHSVWDVAQDCVAAGKVKTTSIAALAITSAHLSTTIKSTSFDFGTGWVSEAYLSTAAVSQAKLKSTTGSVAGTGNLALPGGEYGFFPQVAYTATGDPQSYEGVRLTGSGTLAIATRVFSVGGNATALQRYVTASGNVHWIFLLRDKGTTNVIAHWEAPDHPAYGNGGKPALMPHPFGQYDSAKHDVITITLTTAERRAVWEAKITEAEDQPNRSFWKAFNHVYEVDERTVGRWPKDPVHIGFMPKGADGAKQPIRKIITKPDCVTTKGIRRKPMR